MAVLEGLIWDTLNLNDEVAYRCEEFDPGLPPKKPEWLPGGDADGELLMRDPKFGNRVPKAKIRVVQQSTMDLALASIGALVNKQEESEQQERGLALVWTPAGSTKSLTMNVLSAEIDGLPLELSGDLSGWFQRQPVVTITLAAEPFLVASEVLSSTASASTPAVTMTLASIAGDVRALGRLIVTDLASQSRRWIEWGIQNRYYDAATSLELDSDSMVVTGFSGAQTTRTGAYDPNATGNNVIRTTLTASPTACCGTGNLGHVGTFRVIGRVYSVAASGNPSDVQVRLAWQDGDGPFRANPFTNSPVVNAFGRVDLGLVTIEEKKSGTQKWSGRVEAYSAAAGDTLDVDVLFFVPALEGYGQVRAAYSYSAGALAGRDEFTGTTTGGALNTRVAPSGGTWADTVGVATGFTFSDNGFTPGSEEITRATGAEATTGRFAVLGATTFTDMEVGVRFRSLGLSGAAVLSCFRCIARYVDASNYLYGGVEILNNGTASNLVLTQTVAGVQTVLATIPVGFTGGIAGLRLVVFASGRAILSLLDSNGGVVSSTSATSSALATGGALASGKPGINDAQAAAALTRWYDNFYVAIPAAEPIAIYSTQSAEIRWDTAIREDSTGTFYGKVPSRLGSPFYVPAAGGPNRTSRVQVIAHRNDLETAAWEPITDSTQLQVGTTSRYIATPR